MYLNVKYRFSYRVVRSENNDYISMQAFLPFKIEGPKECPKKVLMTTSPVILVENSRASKVSPLSTSFRAFLEIFYITGILDISCSYVKAWDNYFLE